MESQITEYRHSRVISIGGEKTKFTVQVVHSVYGKTSYPSSSGMVSYTLLVNCVVPIKFAE